MERVDNPSRSPSKSTALTAVPLLGSPDGQQTSRASRAWSVCPARRRTAPVHRGRSRRAVANQPDARLRDGRPVRGELRSGGPTSDPPPETSARATLGAPGAGPAWPCCPDLRSSRRHGGATAAAGHREACRPLTIDHGPRPALRKVLGSQSSVAFASEAPCFVVRAVDAGSRQLSRRPPDLIAVERRFLGEEPASVPRTERALTRSLETGRSGDPIRRSGSATTAGTHPGRGRYAWRRGLGGLRRSSS